MHIWTRRFIPLGFKRYLLSFSMSVGDCKLFLFLWTRLSMIYPLLRFSFRPLTLMEQLWKKLLSSADLGIQSASSQILSKLEVASCEVLTMHVDKTPVESPSATKDVVGRCCLLRLRVHLQQHFLRAHPLIRGYLRTTITMFYWWLEYPSCIISPFICKFSCLSTWRQSQSVKSAANALAKKSKS